MGTLLCFGPLFVGGFIDMILTFARMINDAHFPVSYAELQITDRIDLAPTIVLNNNSGCSCGSIAVAFKLMGPL